MNTVYALDDPKQPTPTQARRNDTDVLVIGGGPAGAWAALAAQARGVEVTLVDKGYCGTSGATAPSGTGVWAVAPDSALRERAMASREALGGHLASREWMRRVLDQTWENVELLAQWGYQFPLDDAGAERRTSLQGPDYMRLLRRQLRRAGVRIVDHSPALALLTDDDGVVCGAHGYTQQTGDDWTIRANSVVMATGGCAFLSKALGTNVLTGDGYLMGAEAGAELSGMEFSNAYGLGPAFSSVTKSLFYNWATFLRVDGTPIDGAGSSRGRSVIGRTLLSEPVYAVIDRAPAAVRGWMRNAQPNFFLPFDRSGIDPFTQKFPVSLRLEGTVRGTGGLRIAGRACETTVAGLYAAGDAATRELICGGFTGGGSHNAAWAISSGFWAGNGAADFSRERADRTRLRSLRSAGTIGLSRQPRHGPLAPAEIIRAVQAEVFPYEHNWFRSGPILKRSLARLDELWAHLRGAAPAARADRGRSREALAMLATARWMYSSALARTESRGMHKRDDYPELDVGQQHCLASGGLDQVWVRPNPLGTALSSGTRAVDLQQGVAA